MSGHSKWETIKRKKGSVDSKRSKVFGIISKQITIAVKEGGSGDGDQNPRLRLALTKARAANMPKSNIKKAIDKGLGKGGDSNIQEILYEGYGPGGVGFLVSALTDNRNRTGSEIKYIFDRNGGSLGGPGSASFMFDREGDVYVTKISVPVDEKTNEQVLKLYDAFDEHEDVESIAVNAVVS